MAREDLHFRLRIPEELKKQIERAANENHRSMTAEIVSRLEESLLEPVMLPPDLMRRIKQGAEQKGLRARNLVIDVMERLFPGTITFGEFLDEWAKPIAHEANEHSRSELIEEANRDERARWSRFSIRETESSEGLPQINVYQWDIDDRDATEPRLLAIMPVYPLMKNYVRP